MQVLPLLQQKTSWFTMERREWVAAVVLAGAIGFGFGNGHTTQGAIAHVSEQLGQKKAVIKTFETQDIPTLKSEVGCQAARSDTIIAVEHGDADQSDIPRCPPPSSVAPLGKR